MRKLIRYVIGCTEATVIVAVLLRTLIGTPGRVIRSGDDWHLATHGGLCGVVVWEDHYAYGAMLLQDRKIKTGGTEVLWWLRFERMKRK